MAFKTVVNWQGSVNIISLELRKKENKPCEKKLLYFNNGSHLYKNGNCQICI